MESIQRMKRSSTGSRRKSGSKRDSMSGLGTTLQAINLSANLPAQAVPLIMDSSHASSHGKKKYSNRSTSTKRSKGQKLWFESPRLELTDSQLFPESSIDSRNALSDPQERWKAVKQQAGKHQQDGSVLILRPHIHSPEVLKCGMPPQAASRVKELHVQVTGDTMPAWMDAIANTFLSLEHLHIAQIEEENRENEVERSVRKTRLANPHRGSIESTTQGSQETDEEEARLAAEHSDRLKRLYILYRLPDLVSIDGRRVTTAERRLARPDDPNGERVKKNEWVHNHDKRADIRILLPEGEESVEIDMFNGSPCAKRSLVQISPSNANDSGERSIITHREKSVEVDLVGPLVTENGPLTSRHSSREDKKEEFCDALACEKECSISDNASMVTADCEWSAACGTLALWTKPTQKTITSESSGPAIRRSSSWKDCRKLVSAITSDRKTRIRSTRLVPRREPLSQGMMYKSASRPAAAMSSPSAMTSRSARRSSLDRLGPVDFAESPSTKKLDNKKKKKKTASTSSKHSISTKIITHPQPEEAEKVPSPKSSPKASTKQTVRVPASKSLTSPFPMQFRDRSTPQSPSGSNETITAVEVDISSNLEIKTSEESGQSGPSAPPIPPPPPSSRSGAPTLIPEMETIDSNEFIYRTETSSPTSLASKQKIDASNKTDLPPTCPSTSSRKVVTHKPKRKKKKHDRIAKWKAQQSARQTSIMDDEVDDDDDDDISSGSESETDEESDEVGVVASPIASVE